MVTTREEISKFLDRRTDHYHAYKWDNDTGCGFTFQAFPDGKPVRNDMSDITREYLSMCEKGEGMFDGKLTKIIDLGHEKHVYNIHRCKCGSNLEEFWLVDYHHIALCMVCNNCIDRIKKNYQDWVFSGINYDAEIECPIESEEDIV